MWSASNALAVYIAAHTFELKCTVSSKFPGIMTAISLIVNQFNLFAIQKYIANNQNTSQCDTKHH